MSVKAESMQNPHPTKKKLYVKNLKEVIEELVKKYEEDPYVYFNEKKIQKTLKQYIPYTAEEWANYQRDKASKDRKHLNSFIDKVFFEDGALQLEKHTSKYKHGYN